MTKFIVVNPIRFSGKDKLEVGDIILVDLADWKIYPEVEFLLENGAYYKHRLIKRVDVMLFFMYREKQMSSVLDLLL